MSKSATTATPLPLQPQQRRLLLQKQISWSPDTVREEAWIRRKHMHKKTPQSSKRNFVSDDDLEELKACFELGFGFDHSSNNIKIDPKLSTTFPALELYHEVNKQYNKSLSRSSSVASSDGHAECPSPKRIIHKGDEPEKVKTKLKQWAQVVACSVTQSSSSLD